MATLLTITVDSREADQLVQLAYRGAKVQTFAEDRREGKRVAREFEKEVKAAQGTTLGGAVS